MTLPGLQSRHAGERAARAVRLLARCSTCLGMVASLPPTCPAWDGQGDRLAKEWAATAQRQQRRKQTGLGLGPTSMLLVRYQHCSPSGFTGWNERAPSLSWNPAACCGSLPKAPFAVDPYCDQKLWKIASHAGRSEPHGGRQAPDAVCKRFRPAAAW